MLSVRRFVAPIFVILPLLWASFGTAIQAQDLLSRWGSEVTPENVWAEYPRPQMQRDAWQNLNGEWDFALLPKNAPMPADFDQKILVPFAAESVLSGIKADVTPDHRLWYQRTFTIPAEWDGQDVILHFGAVDYESTVWVNGALVGAHKGGFDPFFFNITDYLQEGDNNIVVSAYDPSSAGDQPRGKQRLQQSGIWYTPVSGIWQTVWLEPVSERSIEDVKLVPSNDGTIVADVLLDASTNDMLAVRVVVEKDGEEVASIQGPANRRLTLKVNNPKLWSPDHPELYDVTVELFEVEDFISAIPHMPYSRIRPIRHEFRFTEREMKEFARATRKGPVMDRIKTYTAFREVSLGKGAIEGQPVLLLNGQPLFQNGTLDQGWWPDGLLTPPADEAMVFELEFLKASGFNMLRKHIKVEPARYYYHADRLGIMIWQDMPSGLDEFVDMHVRRHEPIGEAVVRPHTAEQYEFELHRMINHLDGFPSIVMWVPFNEGWGQYDTVRIGKAVKALDPTRLVHAVSGWYDAGDEGSEIYSIHTYDLIPQAPEPHANRAIVLGEFGGVGWPIEGHMWDTSERKWGYQTYHNQADTTAAYKAKYDAVIDQYKTLGLAAAIYTQTSDVEQEVNGLLTYDREMIKIPTETLAEIHAPLFEQ